MNKELMIFEGVEVEVFEFKKKVLFNPYHCGKCLDISPEGVRKAITRMNEKQVIKLKNSDVTNCHIRKLNNAGENFLTESGVYKLIFKSKKKGAEKFQDWVTDEVLPTIRKTGGFVEDTREEEFINNYFPSFSEEVKLAMVQDLRKQNEILKPKAERFDKFLDSNKTYSFTDVAKLISTKATDEGLDIKISNQKLTELLREKSILTKDRIKTGFKNNPRKDYEEYFNVVVAHDKDGNTLNKTQTRVKPIGVDFIYKIVKENI